MNTGSILGAGARLLVFSVDGRVVQMAATHQTLRGRQLMEPSAFPVAEYRRWRWIFETEGGLLTSWLGLRPQQLWLPKAATGLTANGEWNLTHHPLMRGEGD